jgi:acyl-CoA thioesterase-2
MTVGANAVASACDVWDCLDIEALVSLDQIGPLRYRSRYGDGNLNGRSYGGQVLGQAMMAASLSAPESRSASAFQLLFLRGADPNQRIDFEVTILQEGKRFSSRHIAGFQDDGRTVLNAHATFCAPQPAPSHAAPSFARGEDPETLPALSILPPVLAKQLRPLGPYSNHIKPCLDFRVPDIEHQLSAAGAQARLRYWLRSKCALASDSPARAAVFAYLSDWWLNFSSVGCHLRDLQSREPLYMEGGRGLSIARVHDQDGLMLATATQESLMVHPGE